MYFVYAYSVTVVHVSLISKAAIKAQRMLKQKGLRSYFALKKMIDLKCLKKSIVFKLFDALILPVVTYGCQIWFAETWFTKKIKEYSQGNFLSTISKDPLEQLHLTILKWSLGVNRKTSNAAIWAECGRYPLAILVSKQVFNYFDRLHMLDANNIDSLVRHAFAEQKRLNMNWFKNLNDMRELLMIHASASHIHPSNIRSLLEQNFQKVWNSERKLDNKTNF